MKTIDADELVKDIDELSKDAGFYRPIYEGFKNWINSKQAVDAVPVVRCRECIHKTDDENENGSPYCLQLEMYLNKELDFFCKYGERREGAD